MQRIILNLFLFFSFFYILPLFSPIQASKVLFSDNFDDGDFDNWSEKRSMQWQNPGQKCKYFFQDASWDVVTGKVGIKINGPGCVTELTPDNFSLEGIKNFSYQLDVSMPISINVDRNYVIRYISQDNWIGIHLLNNQVYLQKYINGVGQNLQVTTYNFQANQTYTFKNVILENNRIKVSINDKEVINFIDNNPFSQHGTIGLQASVGAITSSEVRFDNIVVTELDSTSSLDVPFFSQNDPAWGQDEYDSASQYEWGKYDDTIDGWGCYITSAAMLLRFHGHTTLPDGSELNPKTLNEWLLSFEHKQDGKGYQGGGLNPLAITRLTQLNSELNNNLPKLEYLKVNKDDQLLESKLKENQPVILYVPTKKGHFVVARGLQDDTFILNDPEATQEGTLLTEYGDYLSMRTFTPSNTDLSYFLFFPSSPNLELTLKNQNGEVVPLEIIMDDAIAHQTIPGLQQPEMKVWGIPKPETGAYTLEVTSPSPGPFTVETHLYNNKAESNITETTGFVGDEPKILNIDFDKEESGQVVEEVGFEQFIQDLDLMWELKHFKKYPIYRAIRLEANIAERANKKITKLALAKTIQRSIQLMKPSTLSTEGKEYLLHRIDLLIENLKSN